MSAAAQIVVPIHQAMKQLVGVPWPFDQLDSNGSKGVDRRFDGLGAVGDVTADAPATVVTIFCRWQCDQLALVKLSQHRTAGHILEHAGIGAPVPQPANLDRQPGAGPVGILGDQTADQLNVRRRQLAPLDGHAHEATIHNGANRVQHELSKIIDNRQHRQTGAGDHLQGKVPLNGFAPDALPMDLPVKINNSGDC